METILSSFWDRKDQMVKYGEYIENEIDLNWQMVIVWNGDHLENFKSKWYWNCLIAVLLNGFNLDNLKRELDRKWPNVELSCIGNFNINNDNDISKPILILQDFLKYLNICVTWRYLGIYYTTLWKSFQRMSSTGSDQIVVVWKREHFENEFIL
jgi:hypothetical protein